MTTEIKTVRKRIKMEEIQAFVCDRCKKRIDAKGKREMDDWIERQEMLHWRMLGGYGSVFGDGCLITLDLCQGCTKEVLGAFVQIHEQE